MNLLPIHALLDRNRARGVLHEFAEVLAINGYAQEASQYESYAEDLDRACSTRQFIRVWRRVAGSFSGGSGSITDAQARGTTDAQRLERAKRFYPSIEDMNRFF